MTWNGWIRPAQGEFGKLGEFQPVNRSGLDIGKSA
jgi:hypothetical protein